MNNAKDEFVLLPSGMLWNGRTMELKTPDASPPAGASGPVEQKAALAAAMEAQRRSEARRRVNERGGMEDAFVGIFRRGG